MRRIAVLLIPALSLGLCVTSLATAKKHSPAASTPSRTQAQDSPAMPETVYGDISDSGTAAGLPETIRGGQRMPSAEGMPVIIYAEGASPHVREISAPVHEAQLAAEQMNAEASVTDLPVTINAGEPEQTEMASAGHPLATGVELPVTMTAAERQPVSADLPETIYGVSESAPVHEAQLAAEAAIRDDGEENAESSAVSEDDATAGAHYPVFTASPYGPFTDAQRVDLNPCEIRGPAPSPYGPLTDAQRAAQTNCQ
jgi:hypothetical protein